MNYRIQHVNPDYHLPEWKDYVAANVDDYTETWMQAYFTSPEWRQQKNDLSQAEVRHVFETLVEQAYDQYRKTPKSWSKEAIAGVMTGYLVSNVAQPLSVYPKIGPALIQLIDYVAKRGWLNATRATAYQRQLEAAAETMVKYSKDRSRFSVTKMLSERLYKMKNVNIDNETLQQIIPIMNANGGYDALYDDQAWSIIEAKFRQARKDQPHSAAYQQLTPKPEYSVPEFKRVKGQKISRKQVRKFLKNKHR